MNSATTISLAPLVVTAPVLGVAVTPAYLPALTSIGPLAFTFA